MGVCPSNNEVIVIKSDEQLEREAMENFNLRVKNYSYPHHGPYHEYIDWCRAQYQLECIQPYCRQGANYSPKYDNWGNQYY
jgi:hypothetical protein